MGTYLGRRPVSFGASKHGGGVVVLSELGVGDVSDAALLKDSSRESYVTTFRAVECRGGEVSGIGWRSRMCGCAALGVVCIEADSRPRTRIDKDAGDAAGC